MQVIHAKTMKFSKYTSGKFTQEKVHTILCLIRMYYRYFKTNVILSLRLNN